MRFKNRRLWLVVLILVVLIVFLFTIPIWSKLCYRCDDVDIKTGRTRHARYLLYCKISEKIEDSILTQTIGQFPDGVQPDWQRVNRFDGIIGNISPHYAYHGAIAQIHLVAMIWQSSPFSNEAKKQVARTILDKWQADGNCFGVNDYIRDLIRIEGRKTKSDSKAIISATDLPSTRNQ